MTLTQWGLLADMFGVALLLPRLNFKRRGIPFHPKMWDLEWWQMVAGVVLVIGGFFLQFLATF